MIIKKFRIVITQQKTKEKEGYYKTISGEVLQFIIVKTRYYVPGLNRMANANIRVVIIVQY